MMRLPDRSVRRLYVRALAALARYIPKFLWLLIAHSVWMAVWPYAALMMLSRIVDTATVNGNVLLSAVSVCTAVFAVSLIEAAFRRAKEAKWDMLYHAVDRMLVDRLLTMDQATLEDPAVRERLAKIRETTYALGVGLVQLPDMLQDACRGLCGLLAGGALSVYTLMCPPSALWQADGSFPAWWLYGLLWTALLLLSVWGAERARCQRETASEEIAAMDRAYYAFADTTDDPSKAADMRIYGLDRTVIRYMEEIETRFFSAEGVKRRRARGRLAFGQAIASSWPFFWIGFCAMSLLQALTVGAIGYGTFVGCLGMWSLLPREAGMVVKSVRRLCEHAPHIERLFAFLDTPPQMYRGSLTTEKRADREYEIEFRRVSFRYPSQKEAALKEVCVTLRSGSRTAIVGENGSGKTTFIKLLCRLYDPDEGEILLNGIDICKYRREEYSALLSAVFQDTQLLSRSTADNIACADAFDAVRAARCLEDAGADAARLLDEETHALSHSDRQRVAIARALYKDAPFLLLDEPTAGFDPSEEAALYANLDRLIDDRTAVFVSHRLASCRFCDEILVFEDGRIAERGTHKALIAQKGRYHTMWNAQAMYYKTH